MNFSIFLFAVLLAISVFMFALMGYRLFTQAAVRYEERFRESAEANLKDLFIFIDPQKLFAFNLGILVVSAFLIWAVSGNILISVLAAAMLAACPRVVYSLLRGHRERTFSYALPDSMASVASMLRAGSNLQSALELMVKESSGPIRQEFGLLLRELKMGVDFNDALDNMLERIPGEDLRMLTAGMKIAREVGGSLADVLARLAETLRRKLEIEGKIKALTAMGLSLIHI